MTPERLRALLADVASGAVALEDAERTLAWAPVEDLDFARVDHHRALRQGFPEVVFGQGKTPEQIVGIAERIAARGDGFLATRVAAEAHEPLRRALPRIDINVLGRTAWLPAANPAERRARGTVLIVTAGTSDLPVAEEAAVTAAAFGNPVARLTDVGVAGIHRLLAAREALADASVLIVVAGMEGALPSVVGGLVAVPVIAVPTSVGYGASFGGVSALLGMLNSCASGVTVVNIDNGFGAAAAASRINLPAAGLTISPSDRSANLPLAATAPAYAAALFAAPRLAWWGAAFAIVFLVVLAGWTVRTRGKDAASAAALWPPLHLLLIATGALASPLVPLALAWTGLFARRAQAKFVLPAAGAVAVIAIAADVLDGVLPAWTVVVRWILLMGIGAALIRLSAATGGRGRTIASPAEPSGPGSPRRGGEATDSEAVETALATVMRATDAHEAALWRAEGEEDERTAVLLSRVASPDVAPPESPVPLAGHPFAWAVDERLPQRIERGKKQLPSPWAAEMLLVPVETGDGVRVLALGYPGMVPPGAETAAVRAGHHLSTLLSLLKARHAVRRAEAGLRAMGEAMKTLPGALELNEFAAQLAAAVRTGTGAAGAAVAMVTDEGGGRGKVLHVAGDSIPMDAEAFGEGDSRLALAVKHGVELSHADLRRERDRLPLLTATERWEAPPRSAAVLPLMLDGRAMGAVVAWHPEPGRFGDREMEIVRLLVSVAPLPMRSARRFEALDQRASTDPLTGLANRSTFDARLASLSSYFDRYARPFSVVALDVDFFKKFNDTWGHEAGDRVLQHVAELLRATVRDVDLPARLGGEEFVVLLPETTLRQAMDAAERIRRTLETKSVIWNGHTLRVTASLGVSACPDCTATPAEVLAQADAALYRAKDAGRNQVASAPALHTEVATEP